VRIERARWREIDREKRRDVERDRGRGSEMVSKRRSEGEKIGRRLRKEVSESEKERRREGD
jgi:hypothetical protein